MKQYIHGGDSYRLGDVLDFSININPLGMPKGAKEAALKSLDEVGKYPDWRHEKLIHAISEFHNIQSKYILVGNGASELIYALALSQKNSIRAWIPAPTFMEYEEAVIAAGGRVVSREKLSGSETALPGNCNLVFLCNPNNPTGSLYKRKDLIHLIRLCEKCGALLVIDESFLEFLEDADERTMIPNAVISKNTVILRSMTKIYGMPGLRLGYLVSGDAALRQAVRRVLQPWNLTNVAEAAGCAALKDGEFLEETRKYILTERQYLEQELARYVRKVYLGSADFLFFEADPGLDKVLLSKGILIRNCSDIAGLSEGMYRIGVRSREENRTLVKKFAEL